MGREQLAAIAEAARPFTHLTFDGDRMEGMDPEEMREAVERLKAAVAHSPEDEGEIPEQERVAAVLLRIASSLETYPFESATMAEAGRLAANALRTMLSDAPANDARKLAGDRP